MNDDTRQWLEQYVSRAQSLGDAALDAVRNGDVGLARTAARQAAQSAILALRLQGEEPEENRTASDRAEEDKKPEQA